MIISFIGLQTQEVDIKPVVNVVLKSDDEMLDEVVVTAMGISKEKKALAYYLDGSISCLAGTPPHVQTADERGLARPALADDAEDLAVLYGQGDVF